MFWKKYQIFCLSSKLGEPKSIVTSIFQLESYISMGFPTAKIMMLHNHKNHRIQNPFRELFSTWFHRNFIGHQLSLIKVIKCNKPLHNKVIIVFVIRWHGRVQFLKWAWNVRSFSLYISSINFVVKWNRTTFAQSCVELDFIYALICFNCSSVRAALALELSSICSVDKWTLLTSSHAHQECRMLEKPLKQQKQPRNEAKITFDFNIHSLRLKFDRQCVACGFFSLLHLIDRQESSNKSLHSFSMVFNKRLNEME